MSSLLVFLQVYFYEKRLKMINGKLRKLWHEVLYAPTNATGFPDIQPLDEFCYFLILDAQ